MRVALGHRGGDAVGGRVLVQRMAQGRDRRVVAAAHARRAHDAHARAEFLRQLGQDPLAAHQGAGQAVAHAYCERRRRRLVLHHDVEMRIERGDLVDLDERELHLLRQRREVARVEAAELVLDEMQELDQQIAPARLVAQQRLDLGERIGLDLAAAREIAAAAASGTGMDAARRLRG